MTILATIVGAAIALIAYHTGRNNQSPIKPLAVRDWFAPHPKTNSEPPKPVTSTRGM